MSSAPRDEHRHESARRRVGVGGLRGLRSALEVQADARCERRAESQLACTSHLAHTPGKPTLLFFAHPRCPCTRASVAELNSIMGRFAGKVTAEVVFMHAGGEPEAWSQSDSFVRAQSIPGVSVTSDRDGHEAALFGALTSGHVMLYDRAGTLTFSGGITPARGHEGDSPARQRLLALLAEETSAPVPNAFASALVASGAVYGCSLEDGPR